MRSTATTIGSLATRAAVVLGFVAAVHATPSPSWIAEVERQIADAEYEIGWQPEPAAWHAPNRAQGFRTYFTPSGIRVIPRSAQPSWEWQLALVRWGRPAALAAVEPAALQVDGQRIEYDRGGIVEWYVNDRRGLEQGFTLAAPPEGTGLVEIELALGGTLSPVVSEDGQAIDFQAPNGTRVLHYAALVVRDALGQELVAWMEGFNRDGERGIRIAFEDGAAIYPVTVDPLATSAAWTGESDQADAEFGISVATAGDVNGDGYADVIVGADAYDNGQVDEGRAYAYHGSPAGLSSQAAWMAEGDQAGAKLGTVATAGDVNGDGYSDAIVGAYLYDNGQTDEGRAFVYNGSVSGLSAASAWTAAGAQAGSQFGYSVATAGDVNGDGYSDVVVGATLYDNGQANEGRAFVYFGSAAGLQPAAAWTAESGQLNAELGVSVGTAGDVNADGYSDVIVGAFGYDNGQLDEGRALVYHGSSAGPGPTASWTVESNQVSAQLGVSVGTAGDVNGDGFADAIVGALFHDDTQVDEGGAFVYHGSAAGLSPAAVWTAAGAQASAQLGVSVATAGDVNGDGYADVIVGADLYDNGEASEGRAFVYHGSASGLSAAAVWTAESDQPNAHFGFSVGTAGDVNGDGYADVIAGANFYDNGQTEEGRAFVYHGSAAGLSLAAGWTAESNQASAQFGFSVATAGDVNGDGYADVIAGASGYDNGQTDEGRAFVYHGSAAGLSSAAAWTAESNQAGARFGLSVATAGDVNGDGYADATVGADGYDNGQTDEGRAFVYHGSAAGLSAAAAWTGEGDQAGAQFGISVATAGDVDGDGYADVIVGACGYDSGQTNEGRAFAYHGSPAGLASSATWIVESNQANALFGFCVAPAGDVNGDGYSDAIVGADFYDNGQTDEGRAFVYHGSAAGLSAAAGWTAESNQASAHFGFSLATAGDVNRDGYSDVVVGAYSYDNGQTDEGRAFAYHGSVTGLSLASGWTAESDQASARFGSAVAPAGDVNGDGYSDVAVGANFYANGQPEEGRAFVHHGAVTGLTVAPAWSVESNQSFSRFGSSLAMAGDVNGDGYSDVIVGASFYDNGQADEGQAFVYYGNAGPGLSLRPQQRHSTDTGAIAQLGVSNSPDSFRLALLGRTPFGRGGVKLEWEVKPLGALLNGLDTQTAVHSSDSGTSGKPLSHLVSDLVEAMPYHWRVRLRYDAATVPFQQRSRWLTVPWNGGQETDLRTAATSAGEAPGLRIDKAALGQIRLSWDASCLSTDTDYAIYEGTLGSFTSHASRYCTTEGETTRTFTPPLASAYYLVVPRNDVREGSYGTQSDGDERPIGLNACRPRQAAACE